MNNIQFQAIVAGLYVIVRLCLLILASRFMSDKEVRDKFHEMDDITKQWQRNTEAIARLGK